MIPVSVHMSQTSHPHCFWAFLHTILVKERIYHAISHFIIDRTDYPHSCSENRFVLLAITLNFLFDLRYISVRVPVSSYPRYDPPCHHRASVARVVVSYVRLPRSSGQCTWCGSCGSQSSPIAPTGVGSSLSVMLLTDSIPAIPGLQHL